MLWQKVIGEVLRCCALVEEYRLLNGYFNFNHCAVTQNNFHGLDAVYCRGWGLTPENGGSRTMDGRLAELDAHISALDKCDGMELVDQQKLQSSFQAVVAYGSFLVQTDTTPFYMTIALEYFAGDASFQLLLD